MAKNRKEAFFAAIAGEDVGELKPKNRQEAALDKIAKGAGGSGGGGMKYDYLIRDDADNDSGFEFIGMTSDEFYKAAQERPLVGYVGRPGRWDIVLETGSTGVMYSFYYQPQPITFNKLRRIYWDTTNGSFTCEDVEAMS